MAEEGHGARRPALRAEDVARAASRLASKAGDESPLVEELARELGVEPETLRGYLESVGDRGRPAGPLDRERVISAAIEIADEHGLEQLTLRRVATRLGVTPMALYRYVDSKDAMLDGMIDQLLAAVVVNEAPEASWQQSIRDLLHALRDVFAPHPGVATLAVTRPVVLGEHAAGLRDVAIGALRRGGLQPREAFELFDLLVNVACALMLRDASLAAQPNYMAATREERLRRLHEEVASFEAGRFPHLAEAIEYWTDAPDPQAEFDRALEILISGLEAEVEALRGFEQQ
jgi:TetR/AcrR family tetracycline transcriptional repressor